MKLQIVASYKRYGLIWNSNTKLFNLPGATLECLKWGLRVKTAFVKLNFVVTKWIFEVKF